jgi:branched-chain amino acid transport system permease protein
MLTIGVGYVLRGVITMIPDVGTDTHTLPAALCRAKCCKLGHVWWSSSEQLVIIVR